jgi:hypothetical protein
MFYRCGLVICASLHSQAHAKANLRISRLVAQGLAIALLIFVGTLFHCRNVGSVDLAIKALTRVRLVKRDPPPGISTFYDFNSAPQSVVEWVRGLVDDGECEKNPKNLVVSCCRPSCGGFADRVRALGTLLSAAERSGRRLCLTRDYFLSAPIPVCDRGSYVAIRSSSKNAGLIFFDRPADKNGPYKVITTKQGEDPLKDAILHHVRYVSSSKLPTLPKSVINTTTDVDGRDCIAWKVGMIAVAVSKRIDLEMTLAREAVAAVIGVASQNESFVSLHVRTGGSTYTSIHGQQIKAAEWDGDFDFQAPNSLLIAAKAIPRNTVCAKPLYIARYFYPKQCCFRQPPQGNHHV